MWKNAPNHRFPWLSTLTLYLVTTWGFFSHLGTLTSSQSSWHQGRHYYDCLPTWKWVFTANLETGDNSIKILLKTLIEFLITHPPSFIMILHPVAASRHYKYLSSSQSRWRERLSWPLLLFSSHFICNKWFTVEIKSGCWFRKKKAAMKRWRDCL